MKLQIMSDLHLEMHADRGAEFIRELDPTGVDVLVLAGDITMARDYEDLESVFEPLARKYRKILYVPGNHESQNVAFEKALITKTEPGDVVVTHHMPAPESVPSRFARSAMNAFFVCDMTSHLRDFSPSSGFTGTCTTAATTCSPRPGSSPTRSGIRTRSEASKHSIRRFRSTSELR
jgi:hypothetical protein